VRIVSFEKLWPKLTTDRFTTFRFPRKDKPLAVGELVQVAYKARSPKDHTILGLAEIKSTVPRQVWRITKAEALADGFTGTEQMLTYLNAGEPNTIVNKITLVWTQRWLYLPEQKPHVAKLWAELLDGHIPIYGERPQYVMRQEYLTRLCNEAVGSTVVTEDDGEI